jgi:hypothetical protein
MSQRLKPSSRRRESLTAHPPCEDLLYIQLQGRAPRAGPGLVAAHAKAPRDGGADDGAAQLPLVAGWPPETVARRGVGCLPLALRATSAPTRTQLPRPPHGQRAVTSATARGAANGGHPSGARILKPCVLTVKSARCARVAARSLRASGPLRRRDSGAPVGGMARTERYPTL